MANMPGDPRHTHAYRKLRAKVLAMATHCALCGLPLSPDARPRSRWSSTVDHLYPVQSHPWLALMEWNLRGAHLGCNVRRENLRRQAVLEVRPSRRWYG